MTTKNYLNAEDILPVLTFADVIETIRLDLELTKVAMAEKLKISKSQYGNFTKGIESVSIKRAGEWANILGYPEKLFIQYAIQDALRRYNYNYTVSLGEVSKKKKRA